MRRLLVLLLVLPAASGACELPAGCRSEEPSPGGEQAGDEGVWAPVQRVVDGDTIRVRHRGESERVRYIGIDTPEMSHPRVGREPFGPEATEANRELVEGERVRLVFGPERRDDYDRLLAYVYLEDGTFVNAELVEQGWAEPLRVPPNDGRAQLFERLAEQARSAGRGIWAAKGSR